MEILSNKFLLFLERNKIEKILQDNFIEFDEKIILYPFLDYEDKYYLQPDIYDMQNISCLEFSNEILHNKEYDIIERRDKYKKNKVTPQIKTYRYIIEDDDEFQTEFQMKIVLRDKKLSLKYLNKIYLFINQDFLQKSNKKINKNELFDELFKALKNGESFKQIYVQNILPKLTLKEKEVYSYELTNNIIDNKYYFYYHTEYIDINEIQLLQNMVDLFYTVKDLSPQKHFFSTMDQYIDILELKNIYEEMLMDKDIIIEIRKLYYITQQQNKKLKHLVEKELLDYYVFFFY